MLTLAGPKNKLEEAKTMAIAFVLRSQQFLPMNQMMPNHMMTYPFLQSPFMQNLFMQSSFMQNPFMQNHMMQNHMTPNHMMPNQFMPSPKEFEEENVDDDDGCYPTAGLLICELAARRFPGAPWRYRALPCTPWRSLALPGAPLLEAGSHMKP